MRSVGPDSWIWLVGALTAGAAAVSLWLGAARAPERDRAGYRWLAGAALLWCAGSAGERLFSAQLSGFAAPLTFADLLPLLALVPLAAGIVVLAAPADADGVAATPPAARNSLVFSRGSGAATRQFWADLADGYVVAAALFVVGWLALFGSEYSNSGEDPRTFLISLVQPLAGVLVMSALLPLVAAAGRRAALPYLSLVAVTLGDAFGTALRLAGGHEPGGAEQVAKIVGYLLLGAAPWLAGYVAARPDHGGDYGRRPPVGAIVSALAAAAAALLIVTRVLADRTRVEAIVVLVAGSAMLVLAIRVLGLLRESRLALDAAWVSGGRVRQLADRTSDAVLICDFDGTIRYSSHSVSAYGYASGDIEGRNVAEFVHPEDQPAGQREIRRALGGDHDGDDGFANAMAEVPVARLSCRVRAADGTWRHVDCTLSRYQQPGDPVSQLMITARDVSDQVALRQQVTHLTFHDRLTGLPNRAYLEERVSDALGRRLEVQVAALFLDLDGFMAVNDSAGHSAGDLLLIQAARRLRGIVPPPHTLARWGGDEFAVVMETSAGAKEVVDLAEQLTRCIAAEPFGISGREIALTASVGVALAGDSPAGNGSADDIMRNADVAVSRAKASGGGRVEIFATSRSWTWPPSR